MDVLTESSCIFLFSLFCWRGTDINFGASIYSVNISLSIVNLTHTCCPLLLIEREIRILNLCAGSFLYCVCEKLPVGKQRE